MKEIGPVLFIVVLVIVYYAWKEYNSPGSVQPVNRHNGIDYGNRGRKCLACGFKGSMKTWLANYGVPQFIALLGLLFFIVPGLIFIAVFWGKYKCPSCGAVGKNQPIRDVQEIDLSPREAADDTKTCPFCAETVKRAAIICRYCNRDLPA